MSAVVQMTNITQYT